MTALLAQLNRDGRPVEQATVEAMLAPTPHRAWDGQGIWIQHEVALAHQHFWISPEEVGEEQPLVYESGPLAISCSIRLDNRSELIHSLALTKSSDDPFTDAELILESYRRWGFECAHHFLGEFAIAIWDGDRRSIFLARDPLGVRNLCYYLDDELFLAATEIGQIVAHPAVTPQINEGKVAEYLSHIWEDDEETFYKSILYCPPAHCLLVSADSFRKWRYWDFDPSIEIRYKDDRQYAEHFLSLLREAIQSCLRTNYPIGISLSGGLDSTSVASLAAGLLSEKGIEPQHFRSYSYVFDECAECDEREYIQPVLDRYGIEADYVLGDNLWTLSDLDCWPINPDFIDQDPFVWLIFAISQRAMEAGSRVILTGHFGDNLFLGGRYWLADMLRERRFREITTIVKASRSTLNWNRDVIKRGVRPLLPNVLRHGYRLARPYPLPELHPGLPLELQNSLKHRIQNTDYQRRQNYTAPGQWERHRIMTYGILSQGAVSSRRLFNQFKLERVDPLRDRRLAEFVMAIPAHQLSRPDNSKWLLRRSMSALLPEKVRKRVGKSVVLPLFELGFLNKEKKRVEEILKKPRIVQQGFIRSEWLQENLDNRDEIIDLWRCVCLELWLQRFW